MAESGPGSPVRNNSSGRRKTEKFSELTANLDRNPFLLETTPLSNKNLCKILSSNIQRFRYVGTLGIHTTYHVLFHRPKVDFGKTVNAIIFHL